jgi:hypothetical protein
LVKRLIIGGDGGRAKHRIEKSTNPGPFTKQIATLGVEREAENPAPMIRSPVVAGIWQESLHSAGCCKQHGITRRVDSVSRPQWFRSRDGIDAIADDLESNGKCSVESHFAGTGFKQPHHRWRQGVCHLLEWRRLPTCGFCINRLEAYSTIGIVFSRTILSPMDFGPQFPEDESGISVCSS